MYSCSMKKNFKKEVYGFLKISFKHKVEKNTSISFHGMYLLN